MEETLKQYMNEYYRGFTGFGIEHIYDFARCITYYKRISLEEYEKKYLDEDILFPPGNIKIGIRDERNDRHMHMNENILIDFAVFTMKLGGETIKRILEKILLGISIEGAVKEGAAVDDELELLKVKSREDKEKIDILEKEKKIAEERIKSLENDVTKLEEIETTSKITASSKQKRCLMQKMSPTDIKKRYEWQAYKKFNDLPGMPKYENLKTMNQKYGGHFSKIIKINKIKYILIYFNNENDLLKAIYKSTMDERWVEDKNAKPPTDHISTIPRTLKEHEELDNLNSTFKGRLEELEKMPTLPSNKGKKKAVEISDDDNEEKTNKNKKRVVRKQGEREILIKNEQIIPKNFNKLKIFFLGKAILELDRAIEGQ
ncbi:hypothetical protein RhiirB3_440168 [Rhizophagus irregularis]|nr:hypothetical protein RhiirB3_440168 [Rhizophagus irregularis]